MKYRLIIFALLLFLPAIVVAQTATPSTTLCAAQTATSTSVCLTATTHVVNGTGVYVDFEYEEVILTGSTPTGPAYINVRRGARAGGPPVAHATSSVAWLALTPDQSTVAGLNGFLFGTQIGDTGTCTRTSEIYLPHIWVARGIKRDCNAISATGAGTWTTYSENTPYGPGTIQVLAASTQTLPAAPGTFIITYAGSAAVTLTAPTAGTMDGMILKIYSGAAQAYTITCTSSFASGGTNHSVLTLASFAGAGVTLMAYNGYWYIIANNLATLTS